MKKLILIMISLLSYGCMKSDWDNGTDLNGLCQIPNTWHYCSYTLISNCGCGEWRGASYLCAPNVQAAIVLLGNESSLMGEGFGTSPLNINCTNTGYIGHQPKYKPQNEGDQNPYPDPLPDFNPANTCQCE